MRNHDQKTKNMQRSVLPSTRRKAARAERRQIHKRARSRERDALDGFERAADPYGFDPDFGEGVRKSTTGWMVLDRRAGDKIGPLTRWTVRTVETDPELRDAALHEQVAYFAALLPDDLIGGHAVFHIRWALRWRFHRDTTQRSWRPANWDRRPTREERRARVAADARRILEHGRHRELNAALRRAYTASFLPSLLDRRVPASDPRLLHGLHDIDGFAAEVSAYPWVCEVITAQAALCRQRS